MIIANSTRIYDVRLFLAGLQQAAAGVARLTTPGSSGERPEGTAWFITPGLLVYVGPDYWQREAIPDAPWNCYAPATGPNSAPESVPARVTDMYPLGAAHERVNAHLLRLGRSLPGRAPTLKLERPAVENHLFIVHYPQGAPEQKLSFGPLVKIEGTLLRYEVDTVAGSGGAPLFDAAWRLVGVHYAAGTSPVVKQSNVLPHNVGVSLDAILDALRQAPEWPEIAEYHRLADVAGARAGLAPSRAISKGLDFAPEAPLRAAVLWSFDPATFTPDEVETLRPLTSDATAARWTLQTAERQRLLREAGSLKALRAARGKAFASDDPRQRVIDRILAGPPYPLDEVDEADLPYWLQAVRWFEGVAPELPTAGEVNRELERRRVRSRLKAIATDNFQGREEELATLAEWYANDAAPPMVITGIGGVGKSALLGFFALTLPAEAVLLWLDFDRADIAPDDAVSMLRLLGQQVALQVAGFTAPEPVEEQWQEAAHALGVALAAATAHGPAPLLALDGFEVAQHVRQYGEIWDLLEALLADVPRLHVVVSGRAPVRDLKLAGRASQSIHLTGLARPDAEALLAGAGITDPALVGPILDISQGVPLMLLLAVYWRRAGGEMRELPDDLPRELIGGFLYQRILDRVIDQSLKPLARSALVLRRLTVELLADALADQLPAGTDAADVFERLSRELALVEATDAALPAPGMALAPSGGALILRPEVRSATLRLLEREDADFVFKIDARAAVWYAGQDLADATNVAELVYHRLRIRDVDGAAAVWRPECANLLLRAEEDMPEGAARDWLLEALKAATTDAPPLEAWEKDAVERLRAALGRGLARVAPGILAERPERSANSPLAVYDAFDLLSGGKPEAALERLRAAGPGEGTVGRDRALFAALLCQRTGDRRGADGYLSGVEDEALWGDRPGGGGIEALAVTAGRVRVTVDLEGELELLERLNEEGEYVQPPALIDLARALLAPSAVALPALAQKLAPNQYLESLPTGAQVAIPRTEDELDAFASQVRYLRQTERERGLTDGQLISLARALSGAFDRLERSDDLWDQHGVAQRLKRLLTLVKQAYAQTHGRKRTNAFEVTQSLALRLALLGERRWALATSGLFLTDAALLAQTLKPDDPLALAVAASLAAFVSLEANSAPVFSLLYGDRPLAQIVGDVGILAYKLGGQQTAMTPEKDALAKRVAAVEKRTPDVKYNSAWLGPWEASSIGLYLRAPDPLETLVRRAIGLPDTLPL